MAIPHFQTSIWYAKFVMSCAAAVQVRARHGARCVVRSVSAMGRTMRRMGGHWPDRMSRFFSQPPDDPVSVRVIPVLPHAKSQYKLVLVEYQHGLTTYSNFKPFLDTKTPAPKVLWITNSVKD